jgi:hypothetical protein
LFVFFFVVCKNYYIINIYKYIISYQMARNIVFSSGGRKRRTMRGGLRRYVFGGRKRRTMRGGQLSPVRWDGFAGRQPSPSGGRKRRTMRGGLYYTGLGPTGLGGRKRRTMRGGTGVDPPRFLPGD